MHKMYEKLICSLVLLYVGCHGQLVEKLTFCPQLPIHCGGLEARHYGGSVISIGGRSTFSPEFEEHQNFSDFVKHDQLCGLNLDITLIGGTRVRKRPSNVHLLDIPDGVWAHRFGVDGSGGLHMYQYDMGTTELSNTLLFYDGESAFEPVKIIALVGAGDTYTVISSAAQRPGYRMLREHYLQFTSLASQYTRVTSVTSEQFGNMGHLLYQCTGKSLYLWHGLVPIYDGNNNLLHRREFPLPEEETTWGCTKPRVVVIDGPFIVRWEQRFSVAGGERALCFTMPKRRNVMVHFVRGKIPFSEDLFPAAMAGWNCDCAETELSSSCDGSWANAAIPYRRDLVEYLWKAQLSLNWTLPLVAYWDPLGENGYQGSAENNWIGDPTIREFFNTYMKRACKSRGELGPALYKNVSLSLHEVDELTTGYQGQVTGPKGNGLLLGDGAVGLESCDAGTGDRKKRGVVLAIGAFLFGRGRDFTPQIEDLQDSIEDLREVTRNNLNQVVTAIEGVDSRLVAFASQQQSFNRWAVEQIGDLWTSIEELDTRIVYLSRENAATRALAIDNWLSSRIHDWNTRQIDNFLSTLPGYASSLLGPNAVWNGTCYVREVIDIEGTFQKLIENITLAPPTLGSELFVTEERVVLEDYKNTTLPPYIGNPLNLPSLPKLGIGLGLGLGLPALIVGGVVLFFGYKCLSRGGPAASMALPIQTVSGIANKAFVK